MQVLEKVVQAAEQAFHCSAQRHFVVPSAPHGLERQSVNMVRNEGAVRAGGMAETLAYHAAEHCLESLFIAIIVIPHALQGAANSHLAAGNGNSSVEKIQIW